MTLQEAKERVALLLYSKRFDEIQNSDAIDHRLRAMEHAAELYARSKWDEACEAMKGRICDVYGMNVDQATNPEFKP